MTSIRIRDAEVDGNRLSAQVRVDGAEQALYFQVDSPYREYLTASRADCFVVALLYRAFREGRDIESEVPVTQRLLFQINTFLTKVFSGIYRQRQIAVRAPAAEDLAPGPAVGTGLSCGIDSLYTVVTCSKTPYPDFDLTHLALFNVGSHRGRESQPEMFAFRRDLAERFCRDHGYRLIIVDSNVRQHLPYDYASYYCLGNCAAVLALPGFWRTYYSSSSYPIAQFRLSSVSLTHFETFILDALSTGATKFYSVGTEAIRLEKTRLVAEYPPSYNVLNVCNFYSRNCGECVKCLRTLHALDVLEVLDRYRAVFDVEAYRRRLPEHLGAAYARLRLARDPYIAEVYPALRRKYSITLPRKLRGTIAFTRSRLRDYPLGYIRHRLEDAHADPEGSLSRSPRPT